MSGVPGARYLMDSWIVAGLMSVSSVNTTLAAFGVIVDDRSKKIINDLLASPISRANLTGGYVAGALAVGFIMCLVTLLCGEAYIAAYGGSFLNIEEILKITGIILLSVIACGSMVFCAVSFLKSANSFGAVSTVFGTLIGFLTGIYIPIGQLPGFIQTIIKIFPVSHSAVLFRQVMMERPIAASFAGAPQSYIDKFNQDMGVVFTAGGEKLEPWVSILVLLATSAIFYSVAVFNMSRKHR